jgi:hypothetical protein
VLRGLKNHIVITPIVLFVVGQSSFDIVQGKHSFSSSSSSSSPHTELFYDAPNVLSGGAVPIPEANAAGT